MKRFFAVLFIMILIVSNLFAIDSPTLYSPSNGATLSNTTSVNLLWSSVSGITGYLIEVDTTNGFNS
ncbi:MAG: hypothetical protein J5542_06190, partial [Bacteroidales bacterium]|nr:hypothetical protein [Bacteroidales bacterium]